jgi:energy-converting hydrogenase B subunit D
MTALQVMLLILVAVGGTGVVLTRDPSAQVVSVSFYGIVLATLFVVFQAPDVALSQFVVGAVALPLAVVMAIAKVRGGPG